MSSKWLFSDFLKVVIIPNTFLTTAEAVNVLICEDKRCCTNAELSEREAKVLASGHKRLPQSTLERIINWTQVEFAERISCFLFDDLNKCIKSLVEPSDYVKERVEQTIINDWQALHQERKALEIIISSFRLSVSCELKKYKARKQPQDTDNGTIKQQNNQKEDETSMNLTLNGKQIVLQPSKRDKNGNNKAYLRILHLSDLHFRGDANVDDSAVRKEHIDSFLVELRKAANNGEIDYLCFTGDIANKGTQNDFMQAESLFRDILSIINIEPDRVLICPGNHDQLVNNSVAILYPSNQKEANQYLRINDIDSLSNTFSEFSAFCQKMKFQKYIIGDNINSFLVGIRQFDDLTLACINTAWLSIGINEDGYYARAPWVGLSFVAAIKNSLPQNTNNPVLTIFHHPYQEWNEKERINISGSSNVWKKISSFSNYILCGHSHEIRSDKEVYNQARILRGGCLYENTNPAYETCFYVYNIPIKDNTKLHIEKHLFLGNEWEIIQYDDK